MKKIFIYIFLFISVSLSAQDIVVQTEFPAVVEAGKQFAVSWTVNAGGGEFSVPSFGGFVKLMGPHTSYSTITQNINGKWSQQTTYTYVYYLQATNPGKYTIQPAKFTLKGNSYTSQPMEIEVVGASQQATTAQQGSNATGQTTTKPAGSGEIFVELSVSRNEVFAGEPISASVKLYSRISNLAGLSEVKYPDFTGFLRNDLETPDLNSLTQENVNGVVYGTGVIQNFLLYPQVTGEVKIDPVELTVLIQERSSQSDPFFGDIFASYQNVPRVVSSRPVTIRVKPLPGQKPADFSGITGNVSISSTLSHDTIGANDALTYKIVLTGNGNLKIAEAPSLKLPPDIEVYDPKITDNLKSELNGTSGQKTFEYLLIPRYNGDFTIPEITYSYFNTSTASYEKLTTSKHQVHVRKASDQSGGPELFGGVRKEDVRYLGKDIRFIRTESGKFKKSGSFLLSKRYFSTLYGLPLLLFITIIIARREVVKRNSDITAVRNRKAGKVASKRLKQAHIYLKNSNHDAFYEELLRSVWGYLGDKLNIPVADLTRNNVMQILGEKNIDNEVIKQLAEVLDTCEFARYAPSTANSEMSNIYEKTSGIIGSIENSYR